MNKTPSCKFYKIISNRQLNKGNFYCDLKKENTNINACKDCPHINENLLDLWKDIGKRI